MDDASNDTGSEASIMLTSPERHKIHCPIHFGFKASKKEVKYEALIEGFHLARKLQARNVKFFSDSQLVVNQINDIYLARGEKMTAYLDKAMEQLNPYTLDLRH